MQISGGLQVGLRILDEKLGLVAAEDRSGPPVARRGLAGPPILRRRAP